MRVLLATAAVAAAGAWGVAPQLPVPRSAHAVVVAGGAIHVLGGPGTREVDRFDGHRWTRESQLPGQELNAPFAASVGSKIYVLGGFAGVTNVPTAAAHVFDVRTRKWSAIAPLPSARGGGAAVVLDGKIHVLGGGNSVSTIADHSVFDPTTSTWSDAAPLPRAEGSPAAVVVNGKIWVIGGRSGLSDYGATYVYDPAHDSWSRGPGIPARGTAGAVVWKGSIYLFGGESQPRASVLGDVLRLVPGAKHWQRVATLPTPRNYARAVVFERRIFVVGGSTAFGDVHAATGSTRVDTFTPR